MERMCTKWGDKWRVGSTTQKFNYEYVIFDDSWLSISDYDDKLIAAYDNTDLDIIKIARPKYPHETIRVNYEDVLAEPDRVVWEEK